MLNETLEVIKKLNDNDEIISKYDREIKTYVRNLTNGPKSWIAQAKEELKYATDERKETLNKDIKNWEEEIVKKEEKAINEYDNRKKEIFKSSMEEITSHLEFLKQKEEESILKNNDELKQIKDLINKNNAKNNFDEVSKLSNSAKKISEKLVLSGEKINAIENLNKEISDFNENISSALISDVLDNLSIFRSRFEGICINKVNIIGSSNYIKNNVINNTELNNVSDNTQNIDKNIDKSENSDKSEDKDTSKNDSSSSKNEEYDLAKKALLVAKEKRTKKSLKYALELIDKVPQENLKDELSEEFDQVVSDITKEFMDKTNKLYENIDLVNIYTKDLFDRDKIKEIISLYDALYNDEISELNFKKEEYAKKVDEIVRAYNMQEQNNYKLNKEVTDKKPFSKFQILKEFKPFFVTSIASKILAKRIERNVQKGNKDKVNKLLKKVKEIDIINSPRLFIFKNKLSKLKPKLYKGGINGLDIEEENYYNKYNDKVSSIMLKKLIRISNNGKAVSDKLRVKTVIGQWLELLSKCPEKVVISNEEYSKEDIFNKALDFFNDANQVREFEDETGTIKYQAISNAEYNAYVSEAEDIYNYHNEVDEFYEIPSEDYEGILSSYEELNKLETPYYSNPMYYDEDKKNPVSYMKLSRRK